MHSPSPPPPPPHLSPGISNEGTVFDSESLRKSTKHAEFHSNLVKFASNC